MKRSIVKKLAKKISCIIALLGVSLINMPLLPFIIIAIAEVLFLLFYIVNLNIIHNRKTKKIAKKRRTKKKIEKINKKQKEIKSADELCKIVKELLILNFKHEKLRKAIRKCDILRVKTIKKIKNNLLMITLFCMLNIGNVNDLTEWTAKVATIPIASDSMEPSIASNIEKPLIKDDTEDYSISNNIEADVETENLQSTIALSLEHLSGYPIDEEEFNSLYNLTFYANVESLDEVIKDNISTWIESNKVNTPLDTAVTSSGHNTEYYAEKEKDLYNNSLKYVSSDLLDEIIDGREELMKMYPNGTLAWILANHKQKYALNYEEQTDNEKSILYFYMASIKDTQKSLEFAMDSKTKMERIKYLQARYKDIAECSHINESICLLANLSYLWYNT